jgi:hypothetical protein
MGPDELFLLWIRGEVGVVIMLVLTAIFAFFGVSISFIVLQNLTATAILMLVIALAVLPFVYGYINVVLGDLFFDQEVPGILHIWVQGFLSAFFLMVATTVFVVFGLTLSFVIAVTDVSSLIMVVVAFIVLPLSYGYIGHWLSEKIT